MLKSWLRKKRLGFRLAVISVCVPSYVFGLIPFSLRSGLLHDPSYPGLLKAQAEPVPLDDQESPTERSNAGTRAPCEELVIALVPGDDIVSLQGECRRSVAHEARTLASSPILWFYIPPSYRAANLRAEVSISQNGELAFEPFTITIGEHSGIVGVQLPYQLEPEVVYRWAFELLASRSDRSSNPFVSGTIRRQPSYLAQSLPPTATPLEQVAFYREHDLWHDALSTLIEARLADGEDTALQLAWSELLRHEGLEVLAPMPIHSVLRVSPSVLEPVPQ